MHDHGKPYFGNDSISHALCHAHPLRQLRAVEASTGHAWPVALRRVLIEGKKAVATARQEGHQALEPSQRRWSPCWSATTSTSPTG